MRRRLLVLAGLTPAAAALSIVAGAPPGRAASPAPRLLQPLLDATPSGGELRLEPGVYLGPARVTRPVRLVGGGKAVVDGRGRGHVLEVRASDIRIEGLVLRNSGISLDREDAGISVHDAARIEIVGNRIEDVLFGVYLHRAPGTRIVRNRLSGKDLPVARRGDLVRVFGSSRAHIESNIVIGGRDAVVWFSDSTVVRDNRFEGGRYGMHYMYAHDGVLEGNRFEHNAVGVYLMFSHRTRVSRNLVFSSEGPSGYGLAFKDCDGATVDGNRLVGNRVGVFIDGSPFSPGVVQRFTRNVVAFNDVGLEFEPAVRNNSFTRNGFIDNRQQVAVSGGGVLAGNSWSTGGVGNHWSDYAGYDADRDGIGDTPHRVEDLFADSSDRHPELRFFTDTPAARAVDLASKAFPVLRPEPRLIDDAPLVRLPDIPRIPLRGATGRRWVLAASSAGLLLGAAGLVLGSGAGPRRRPRWGA